MIKIKITIIIILIKIAKLIIRLINIINKIKFRINKNRFKLIIRISNLLLVKNWLYDNFFYDFFNQLNIFNKNTKLYLLVLNKGYNFRSFI